MKINWVRNNSYIEFDNLETIRFSHDQDCCEENYADFNQLDLEAYSYDFKQPLRFEGVPGAGFRFGDEERMFFVPCYSEQNGCYSTEIEILYNGNVVLNFDAEPRFY